MNNQEKIRLYYNLKDLNISTTFYEDIRALRNISYQEIKDCLYKINKKEYIPELSKKFGVPIYDLTTKRYNMLISCLPSYSENHKRYRSCYTLLSEENNNVYCLNNFIYAFDNFSVDQIIHVFEEDSYSVDSSEDRRYDTCTKINRIRHPHEIVKNSNSYSEIQIANKNRTLKPSYLVAFLSLFNLDPQKYIKESKRLNIPICLIEANFLNDYTKSIPVNIRFTDKYVSTLDDELCLRLQRK